MNRVRKTLKKSTKFRLILDFVSVKWIGILCKVRHITLSVGICECTYVFIESLVKQGGMCEERDKIDIWFYIEQHMVMKLLICVLFLNGSFLLILSGAREILFLVCGVLRELLFLPLVFEY